MNEQIKNFVGVCKGIWQSLGNFQKASIVGIALLCFSALGAVIYYGSQPKWHPLVVGVNQENMAKIRDILLDENVPYRLKNGGTSVEVPSQFVSEMKLKIGSDKEITLSSQDVNPYGYVDTMGIGIDSTGKAIKWQEAQQINLQQQIDQMPKILKSRITLNLPQKRPFERQKESSAGVYLTIKQGDYISNVQVESIRHLVASSVSNLKPANVTVVDSSGRTLARFDTEEGQTGSDGGKRREMKMQIERYLQSKVQNILAPVVGGFQNVVAQVDVDLSFQNETKVSQVFNKAEAVIVKRKETEEKTDQASSDTSTNGTSGTSGNAAVKIAVSNPDGTASETGNKTSKKTTEETLEVPKEVVTILRDGAVINKITVAVNIAAGEVKRTESEILGLEELVKNAAGLMSVSSTGRIDTWKVMENKFTLPVIAEEKAPVIETVVESVDHYMDTSLAKNVMGAFLLVVLLVSYKKIFAAEKVESQVLGGGDLESGVISNEQTIEENELLQQAELLRLEEEKVNEEMAILKDATESEPQTIAAVIESWVMKES